MGVGLNWTVGELGICLKISCKTTVDEMGLNQCSDAESAIGVTVIGVKVPLVSL